MSSSVYLTENDPIYAKIKKIEYCIRELVLIRRARQEKIDDLCEGIAELKSEIAALEDEKTELLDQISLAGTLR